MKARKERAKARLETGEAAPTKKTIESMRKLFDKNFTLSNNKIVLEKFTRIFFVVDFHDFGFMKSGFKHALEKLMRPLSNQMTPKLNGMNKMMNLKIILLKSKRQKCF